MIQNIAMFVLLLVLIKSMFIGSDFNFVNWIKYGKEYTNWYFAKRRQEFDPKEKH